MQRKATEPRLAGLFCVLASAMIILFGAPYAAAVEKPAANAQAPINEAQWAKILTRLKDKGITRTLPQRVTEHLGLTKGDETLTALELAVEREGFQHGIYVDPWRGASRLFILFVFRTPDKKWTGFVADPHLALLSAASWSTGGVPSPIPVAEAQPAFDNELTYWAVLSELF